MTTLLSRLFFSRSATAHFIFLMNSSVQLCPYSSFFSKYNYEILINECINMICAFRA